MWEALRKSRLGFAWRWDSPSGVLTRHDEDQSAGTERPRVPVSGGFLRVRAEGPGVCRRSGHLDEHRRIHLLLLEPSDHRGAGRTWARADSPEGTGIGQGPEPGIPEAVENSGGAHSNHPAASDPAPGPG